MILRLLISIFTVSLLLSTTAQAHILITDNTKTYGSILHIIPDDDPIAGQESTLYFDMQNRLVNNNTRVVLTIKDTRGNLASPAIKIDGTLATAKHTFAVQGLYELVFAVRSDAESYIFTHTQRVSRGIASSALDNPSYVWAEALIITTTTGLLLLLTTGIRHRHSIAKQSKM